MQLTYKPKVDKIRSLILTRGYTQKMLIERAKTTNATIASMLKGRPVTVVTATNIANALGVPPTELFE